jgi:putative ABC transport system substrate-binding protein
MERRRIYLSAVALLLLGLAGPCPAATRVLFVLSKTDAPYANLVRAVQDGLAAQGTRDVEIDVRGITEFAATATPAPHVVVSVGVEAARRVAQSNPAAPILHTLVPRATVTEILQGNRNGRPSNTRDSAIYLDQPLGRRLDLIRAALPRHKRLAVMLGPTSGFLLAELRTAAAERGFTLALASLSKRRELSPALEGLLDANDVLLSVADPLIYNSETIHHVLLTTYRYRVPVVGLSRAYVDAGALLAVYSTPEQIGQQVAQLLAGLVRTPRLSALPAPAYPRQFSVSINRRVAASLDLTLESEEILRHKLESLARQ